MADGRMDAKTEQSRVPDIAKNVRTLEWLKAELIGSTGSTLKAILRGDEVEICDELAGVMLSCYLLGRHLGISPLRLETALRALIKLNIEEEHELEKWYGDFTAVQSYLEGR
ncbi:MAG TPA: hypothetical protein GXX40_03690 [Firmicutes bacterium]|nr:hypothetical protein [Bacillota bacterium]